MRPDASVIAEFLETLRKRTLSQHACEALLAGSVSALVITLVLLRPLASSQLAWCSLAALIGGALAWLRLREPARREPALVSLAEARQSSLRNLLVTERELSRVPDRALPYIAARVQRDTARILRETNILEITPAANLIRPIAGAVILSALTIVIAVLGGRALHGARDAAADARSRSVADASASSANANGTANAATARINGVTITVTPPSYTGRPAEKHVDPTSLDVLVGSKLSLSVDATAPALEREFGGARQRLSRSANSGGNPSAQTQQPFADEVIAQETGVLTLTAATNDPHQPAPAVLAQRVIAIAVAPDQPPTVKLAKPAKDLLFPDNTGSVAFEAEATDDFGLKTLTLHYTKVSGSGERYEFTEGELPLALTKEGPRKWRADLTRSLASLQINEGDTFVYHAAATDERPGQSRAVSDSFVIEIGRQSAAIAGGFAIPPDEDKAAISLNALIQKTEKLDARRASMPKAQFAETSLGLAIEQRMVRTQFLLAMGSHGHVDDEVEEAEQSNEVQEGRMDNRGHAAMNDAFALMTRAEQHLTAADTGDALKAQRAALAAVQKALSQQRYFLRTLSTSTQIDPARRLTGDLSEAKSPQWPGADATDGAAKTSATRANDIRVVLQALATISSTLDGASASSGGAVSAGEANARESTRREAAATAHAAQAQTARAAAGRVLALDPASAALRTASDRLQSAAREIDAERPQAARALIQEAANAVLALARTAAAPAATSPPSSDRGLRGANVDALRRAGGSR